MTGLSAQTTSPRLCLTGRSRKKAEMAARSSFQLGRLHVEQSILDFPSLYCVFQRVFSEHWRKETEKLNCFFFVGGGGGGLDSRCFGGCSVLAKQGKIPWAMAGGEYLLTETNLVLICGVLREEFRLLLNLTGTRTTTLGKNTSCSSVMVIQSPSFMSNKS